MTQIKLKGLDARFARVVREMHDLESILTAQDPQHPALQHTMKVGIRIMEIASDCKSTLEKAIATDRRAADVLSGKIGGMLLRHYLTATDLLTQAAPYIPADTPTSLAARVDTLLWLADQAGEEVSIDNLMLVDIARERRRQLDKWGRQHDLTRESHAAILMEEVGEVFKAINENEPAQMEKELIEVAACALKWAAELEYERRRTEERSDGGYRMVEHAPRMEANDGSWVATGQQGH